MKSLGINPDALPPDMRPAIGRGRKGRGTTPEGRVLADLMDLFRIHGYRFWRINSGALRDKAGRPVFFIRGRDGKPYHGFSDIVSIIPRSGRWLACEAKRLDGKPTLAQRSFQATIRNDGGVAIVADRIATLAGSLEILGRDPWAILGPDGREIS